MTVEEIFANLSSHMAKGLIIHDQLSNAYNFLNLCGYKKCHEYHYYEENRNYHCLRDFYLDTYHKMIPEDKVAQSVEIFPANWYKYKKEDVDTNTKRTAIRDLTKYWINWEEETVSLLERLYKELYELGEVYAASKIKYFLKDTAEELAHARNKFINLETSSYDISDILTEQDSLCEKYSKKIKEIYDDD